MLWEREGKGYRFFYCINPWCKCGPCQPFQSENFALWTLKSFPPHGPPSKTKLANSMEGHPSSFVCHTRYQQPCEKAQALGAHACVLCSLFCRIFLYVWSSSTPGTTQFWACAAWCSSKLPSNRIEKLRMNLKGVCIWHLICLYGIEDGCFKNGIFLYLFKGKRANVPSSKMIKATTMKWCGYVGPDRTVPLTSLEDGDGKKVKLLLPELVLKQSRFKLGGNLEIIYIKFK